MVLPRTLVAATAALALMIATAGVDAQNGASSKPAALKNPVKATPASIKAGQQVFTGLCAPCHGPLGNGKGVMATKNPPPADLTDTAWDYGSTDGEIFSIIQNGVPTEKSPMKGIKGKVEDTDIWNVVNFLRTLPNRPTKS